MNWEPFALVMLGGVLTTLGGFAAQWYSARRERKSIARAFAGEIGAIAHIVERRGYIPEIKERIKNAKETGQPQTLRIFIRRNYFQVFESNNVKLGLLPSNHAQDVVKFYTLCKSITEDVDLEGPTHTSGADSVERLGRLLGLFNEAMTLGEQLVPKLERV